jgi:hypothetical protein
MGYFINPSAPRDLVLPKPVMVPKREATPMLDMRLFDVMPCGHTYASYVPRICKEPKCGNHQVPEHRIMSCLACENKRLAEA